MESKTGKTKKEQRALSDAKLLESAINLFGQNGYVNTSLVQIAKGAGVTSGLIVQRYETKENLLFESWKKIISDYFQNVDEFFTVPAGLCKIVDIYRELYTKKYEYFRFLKMLLHRTSLPSSFNKRSDELFLTRPTYEALLVAQKEKRIISGEPHEIFQAFITQVINQIELSDHYGIAFPDYDFFLRAFQFADDDKLVKKERREKVIKSFFNGFDAICYVYVKENRVEELVIPKEIIELLDRNDAKATFKNVAEHTVREDYRQQLIDFYNFDHLNMILKNKNMVHFSVKNIHDKDRIYILSVAKRNENGEISELLMTIHDND